MWHVYDPCQDDLKNASCHSSSIVFTITVPSERLEAAFILTEFPILLFESLQVSGA